MFALADVGQRHRRAQLIADHPLHHAQRGIGSTKRLEAAQPEPGAFVLVQDRVNADAVSKGGQGDQRGRRIAVPGGDFIPGGGEILRRQNALCGVALTRVACGVTQLGL